MNNPETLEYKTYLPGDEYRINELYLDVFRQRRTFEEWQWEFGKTAEGMSNVVLIKRGVEVLAQASLIPIRLYYLDREVLSGKFENSMIRKELRGKKLFGKLERFCLEEAKKNGYQVAWGFSRAAYNAHLKAGYQQLCSLTGYFAIFHPEAAIEEIGRLLGYYSGLKKWSLSIVLRMLSKRFLRKVNKDVKFGQKFSLEEVSSFDERIDILWQKYIEGRQFITVKRSSDYLNWRFTSNPHHNYSICLAKVDEEVVGYIVLTTGYRKDLGLGLKFGFISDFLVLDGYGYVYRLFFQKAVTFWKSQNVDVSIVWIHRKSQFSRALKKQLARNGFTCLYNKYTIPVLVRKLSDKIDNDKLFNEDNWYLTLAFAGIWV